MMVRGAIVNKAIVAVVLGCGSGVLLAQPAYRVVAFEGQAAPGVSGAVFETFHFGVVNDLGDVALIATMDGPAPGTDVGLWRIGPSGTELRARLGQDAPGAPYAVFDEFSLPNINNDGAILFRAELDGPSVQSSNDTGLWLSTPGSLDLLAREGDLLPGAVGLFPAFSDVSPVQWSLGSGSIVAIGGTTSSLIHGPGGWFFPVTSATPVPDETGASFLLAGNGMNGITPSGRVPISATVFGGSVDVSEGNRIYITDLSQGLREVLRSGDPAPGTGGVFAPQLLSVARINDAEDTLIVGLSTALNLGLWRERDGTIEPLVLGGDEAPGAIGALFDEPGPTVLNAHGEAAFVYELAGPGVTTTNNFGIWTGTPGDISLLVRKGDFAPGAAGNVHGSPLAEWMGLNADGLVAFLGELAGGGVNSFNDEAIWMTDRQGTLHQIVREGSPIELAPGDSRVVTSFETFGDFVFGRGEMASGGEDGKPRIFSDRGEVVFIANFADGSSAVVAGGFPPADCPADLAEPFGVLDFDDILAFLTAFGSMGSLADLAEPFGVIDFDDILAFLVSFGAGCP
jgi:hypothetical protein